MSVNHRSGQRGSGAWGGFFADAAGEGGRFEAGGRRECLLAKGTYLFAFRCFVDRYDRLACPGLRRNPHGFLYTC